MAEAKTAAAPAKVAELPEAATRLVKVLEDLKAAGADDVAEMVNQRVLHVVYDAENRVPALTEKL